MKFMLTASIVLYKTAVEELHTILNAALQSSIASVFVLDNSPTDDLKAEVAAHQSAKLTYIHGQGNVGYGRAHNIAIQESIRLGAKYHIILNPDIVFQAGDIDGLMKFMDQSPQVGAVMPNIIYPDGTPQRLCKLLPTPMDIFSRRLLPKSWIQSRNQKYEMHFMGYNQVWNCPNLSGCFMFLRMEVLKQIGGFDDRFFMYFEDTDLIRQIHRRSLTVFYPDVTIVHAHKAEHRTNRVLLKISIESAIKYFNKYGWFFDKERRLFNRRAKQGRVLSTHSY